MGPTERFTVRAAAELYGLDRWGNGYLGVGPDGHLHVQPGGDPSRSIDVMAVVEELGRRGLAPPLRLRFPQLLEAQVERLTDAFSAAIREFHYPATYHPVFPLKVNQHRTVVEGLLQAGWKRSLGLEAGSLAEVLAASVLPLPPDAVLVCNGFKDSRYLTAATLASRLGKEVVIVLEKPFEVEQIARLAGPGGALAGKLPLLGMRIRLQARGTGMWEKSSGATSKFGMTTTELLDAVERLEAAGLRDRVALLHFHVGSQVTEIRHLKAAVREAARVYAKLARSGLALRYLDVGGGLGVDYDGSRTSSDASMNYTVQEYANDVVYGILEVCREEEVAPPRIISESGRMLAAYHSMLITDVRTSTASPEEDTPPAGSDDAQVVQDLSHVATHITVKNYREYYHDALEYRDQLHSLFNHGLIPLQQRAAGEDLFWEIVRKTVRFARTAKIMADEFVELEKWLIEKYVCNFSVFQSLPDVWSLDQVFPVVPIHRLNEEPDRRAMLADISCDSLGIVDKFPDVRNVKGALELHGLESGRPYLLGFLLIGAYQDSIGDVHNLLGSVHEADVIVDSRGKAVIRDVRRGQSAVEVLEDCGYGRSHLEERLDAVLEERVRGKAIDPQAGEELRKGFLEGLDAYTYLD